MRVDPSTRRERAHGGDDLANRFLTALHQQLNANAPWAPECNGAESIEGDEIRVFATNGTSFIVRIALREDQSDSADMPAFGPPFDPWQMAPPWTQEDSQAACLEGWEIFYTDRDEETEREIINGRPYGHRPWEIQALSEPVPDGVMLTDDAHAWALVKQRAAEGSGLHVRALAFLLAHSPEEYRAILESK